jgi:hypothetical protein
MKHVKDGARTEGLKPPIVEAMLLLCVLFHEYEVDFVLTEGTGGRHKEGSLHGRGYAIDVRSRDFPQWQQPLVLDHIHKTLGFDYDAIQEIDHFHVEYDPEHNGGKNLP